MSKPVVRCSLLAFALASAAACNASEPGGGPLDSSTADASRARIPAWMLEDIQPESPRKGQTYGLDTFGGKVVVVTLVEGF